MISGGTSLNFLKIMNKTNIFIPAKIHINPPIRAKQHDSNI